MAYPLEGNDINKAVEKFVDKLISEGGISPKNAAEKEALVTEVTKSLKAAIGEKIPAELFKDRTQQLKLTSLITCASNKQIAQNDKQYTKAFQDAFNPPELAKSLFSPDMNPELAKRNISAFLLAITPPGPGAKKRCDELAERIVKEKSKEPGQEPDSSLEMQLMRSMAAYFYMRKELADMYAFGSTNDGTPFSSIGPQIGNYGAAPDISNKVNASGYLNMDNDLNNPNIDPTVSNHIKVSEEGLGALFDSVYSELRADRVIAEPPRPHGPGTIGSR